MDLCWRRNAFFSHRGFFVFIVRLPSCPVFRAPLQYGAPQSHQFPYPSTFRVLLSGIAIALWFAVVIWKCFFRGVGHKLISAEGRAAEEWVGRW